MTLDGSPYPDYRLQIVGHFEHIKTQLAKSLTSYELMEPYTGRVFLLVVLNSMWPCKAVLFMLLLLPAVKFIFGFWSLLPLSHDCISCRDQLATPSILKSFILELKSNSCPPLFSMHTRTKTIGYGGHIAQLISFSLHTQQPLVRFSGFPRIYLLMLLRFIDGTA